MNDCTIAGMLNQRNAADIEIFSFKFIEMMRA